MYPQLKSSKLFVGILLFLKINSIAVAQPNSPIAKGLKD
jgi:hypothetical protein